MTRVLTPALAALALLGACERDIYTVTMRATDAGFNRHIEVLHENHNGARTLPSQDLLRQIAGQYGHAGPVEKGAFDGSFERDTPGDIGGHGTFLRSATSLGTTHIYLERFRGDDNLSARVERVQDAASTFAELVLGWLDAALAGEPAWPALRESLAGGRLESDARNLALTVWLEKNGARTTRAAPADDEDVILRVIAYLHEHGYVADADLLALSGGADQPDSVAALVTRWLSRGMHVADPGASDALAAISTDETLGASWDAYTASAGAMQILTRWAERAGVPFPEDSTAPEVGAELLNHLTTVATGSEPTDQGAEDEVTLSLACAAEPTLTNGEWSAETGYITWTFTVEPSPESSYLLPALAAAMWAEPDETFQTEHFGSVVLTGDSLASYCAWRGRLGEDEGARWDAMLAGVHDHDEARAAIDAFTFDGVPSDEVTGRTILLGALSR